MPEDIAIQLFILVYAGMAIALLYEGVRKIDKKR